MNQSMPKELVTVFQAGKEAVFFWLQDGSNRRIAYRYARAENPAAFMNQHLVLTEPHAVSIIRIGKIMAGKAELGFYIDVPNLACEIGRNYVTIKTKRSVPVNEVPQQRLRTNRFTVMEIPNVAISVMYDNSGDHQV